MLFAVFLVFQICRLDPVTGQFHLAPEEPSYIDPHSIKGMQVEPSTGGQECTRILLQGGFTKFVLGTPEEIIDRVERARRRAIGHGR